MGIVKLRMRKPFTEMNSWPLLNGDPKAGCLTTAYSHFIKRTRLTNSNSDRFVNTFIQTIYMCWYYLLLTSLYQIKRLGKIIDIDYVLWVRQSAVSPKTYIEYSLSIFVSTRKMGPWPVHRVFRGLVWDKRVHKIQEWSIMLKTT